MSCQRTQFIRCGFGLQFYSNSPFLINCATNITAVANASLFSVSLALLGLLFNCSWLLHSLWIWESRSCTFRAWLLSKTCEGGDECHEVSVRSTLASSFNTANCPFKGQFNSAKLSAPSSVFISCILNYSLYCVPKTFPWIFFPFSLQISTLTILVGLAIWQAIFSLLC